MVQDKRNVTAASPKDELSGIKGYFCFDMALLRFLISILQILNVLLHLIFVLADLSNS